MEFYLLMRHTVFIKKENERDYILEAVYANTVKLDEPFLGAFKNTKNM